MELRPYQRDLINAARSAAGTHQRILIQSSTGSGKTVMAVHMTYAALKKNRRILFVVHRHEILDQTVNTMRAFGIQPGLIAVGHHYDASVMVHVAMIDTLRNRMSSIILPKLVFIDECHHAASNTYQTIIDHLSSMGSVIVGLSATPERLDGKPLGDLFDTMVCGPSTHDLIKSGALSAYDYYAPPSVVDMSGVKKKFGDYDKKEQARRIDKPHVFGDAISHYKRLLAGKRAIAFHINVETSKRFAACCLEHGIPAIHVDGDTPVSARKSAVESFAIGDTLIMTNVGLFGEGFDVPACDGVILQLKTSSLSKYLQMCGRALRTHDGKERAIILDHMDNVSLHGLPDDDRVWTLDGKSRKSHKTDVTISVRQCKNCYYAFQGTGPCPQCGHEIPPTRREIEIREGELEIVQRKEKRKEVGQATTEEMLRAIAKERGYKPGWVRKMLEVRQARRAKI